MANATREAIFRFHIYNNEEITRLEHKHPVPVFLCEPKASQQASQQFYQACLDVLTIVTAQHHDECMSKITAPCTECGKPAKDALKSPMSYLHLVDLWLSS